MIFLFLLSFCSAFANEAPRSLLELGMAAGSGISPDYPSADQSHFHHIAFPVFYYHGKIFRSDREDGARARVVNKPIVAMDVSGSGSFPIDSDDNQAREGMPALDWLGEIGPRVYVRIENSQNLLGRAYVLVRPAFTTDFHDTRGRGLVFGVGVSLEKKNILNRDLTLFAKITGEWASQEYNDYFYSVPAAYQTADRSSYRARAGYLGTWNSLGMAYEFSNYILTTGVSMVSTKNSANEASPLYRSNFNLAAFVGLAWFFYHSEEPGYL